ncbi:STM3941 family protein [Aquibacillus kalidii]|uniref:STM3941 family protein n=1 Tax=Aquibacillus kalidii TaxID=2762597 RepID=UPI0016458426|nr:STM3941 family protein [Aquibacillus kalidii]
MNNEVVIGVKRISVFFYLLISLIFVLFGILMLIEGKWLGLLPVVFFGLGCFIFLKQLFSDQKLIISKEGLTDKTGTIPKLGFIPKEDILSMNADDWFVYFELANKEQYLAKSKAVQSMQNLNEKFVGTGFTISIRHLKVKKKKLIQILTEYGYPIGHEGKQ